MPGVLGKCTLLRTYVNPTGLMLILLRTVHVTGVDYAVFHLQWAIGNLPSKIERASSLEQCFRHITV